MISFKILSFLDDALSQVSSVTSNNAGVYEIPARLRTLHNLVIQYASQVWNCEISFLPQKMFSSDIVLSYLNLLYLC